MGPNEATNSYKFHIYGWPSFRSAQNGARSSDLDSIAPARASGRSTVAKRPRSCANSKLDRS